MNVTPLRSVLVIHPGSLGDVLLSLPALAAIRARYRRHLLVLLAQAEIGLLLQACGVIDRNRATEAADLACLMGAADQVPPSLQQLLQSCDYAAGWIRDPDGTLQATLRRFGVQKICLQPAKSREGVHQSERFLTVIHEAASSESLSFHLLVPEAMQSSGEQVLQAVGIEDHHAVAVCHPGSGSQHKCIPADTMARVIDSLRQTGVTPLIVGGPADDEAVHRVRMLCGDVPVIQRQSLATMASLLARCQLFVGHDSGLTHLAAALRIPVVAMFGPTDPRQWAPRGPHVSVITGPPCACPSWDRVRTCLAKPCLSYTASAIVDACHIMMTRYPMGTKC